MKTIMRLPAFALLAALALSFSGCASPRTAMRPAAPKVTYSVAITGHSTPGDLTDAEWEQIRAAVAKFLDDEGHPTSGEYVLRVSLAAAAPGEPAGWADVKLTFKSADSYQMVASNPLFGYDAGGYPWFYEYRDYYPEEIYPNRYRVPPRRHYGPDDHDHDNDHDHGRAPPSDPHGPATVVHNPNDAQYHHRRPDDPHAPGTVVHSGDYGHHGPANRDSDSGRPARDRSDNNASADTGSRSNTAYSPPERNYSPPERSSSAEPGSRPDASTQTTIPDRFTNTAAAIEK